jgi:uncharacterized protein (TIGR02646 family)
MMFVKKPPVDDPTWKALLMLPPALDVEWADLIDKAKKARQKLIEDFNSGNEPDVSSALYSRYKEFLLKLFNNKCAYCETTITVAQPGDVEHFRPKGRVVDENFKPIHVRHKGKEIEHPGYYWLAYEWTNLLPSCADCNRFRLYGEKSPGVRRADIGAGKADRFPLKDETRRAVVPDAEVNEEALLIDPTRIDPDEHFEFLSNGTIKPKTEEGKATLEVFGLNRREGLLEARALAYEDSEATFDKYIMAITGRNAEREKSAAARVNRMYGRKESYSVMQRLAIANAIAYWSKRKIDITLPLDEVGSS